MRGTGKGDARRMIFSVKVFEKKKKKKRLKTSLFETDFQVVRIIRWYYQARVQSRTVVELQREPAVNNLIHQRC